MFFVNVENVEGIEFADPEIQNRALKTGGRGKAKRRMAHAVPRRFVRGTNDTHKTKSQPAGNPRVKALPPACIWKERGAHLRNKYQQRNELGS